MVLAIIPNSLFKLCDGLLTFADLFVHLSLLLTKLANMFLDLSLIFIEAIVKISQITQVFILHFEEAVALDVG